MSFNSYLFLLAFLPCAVILHWRLSRSRGPDFSTAYLLGASILFFVVGGPTSLAVLTPSILIDYLIARQLIRTDPAKKQRRKILFLTGVMANVVFLGYFKYKIFFLDTVNTLFGSNWALTRTLLPLGISFLTFQKIAFLIDVRKGHIQEVRFPDFMLFTLFFPRAIVGPIIHYRELIPQLREIRCRDLKLDITVGVCLFSIGLFKKAFLAENFIKPVSEAFDVPNWFSDYPPSFYTVWIGVLSYLFELYFDFSGYSDMALGAARMFGIRLPMNFNSPLKARSIIEYWSRWNITLTRFLTSYIYNPLVLHYTSVRATHGKSILWGAQPTLPAIAVIVGIPTIATMMVSGVWHGAGWQFVLWGLLQGLLLTLNQTWRILRPRFWPDTNSYERVMRPTGWFMTFVAVAFSLAVFRAPSVAYCLPILKGMIGLNGMLPQDLQLADRFGLSFPWSLGWDFFFFPLKWIALAFLIVLALPNSLEYLKDFQPALDYEVGVPSQTPSDFPLPVAPDESRRRRRSKFAVRRALDRMVANGQFLTGWKMTLMSIIFILGLIAVGSSSASLYWQF